VLTPLVEADADTMVEVLGDPRMYEFTGGRPPTFEELRSRYGRLAAGRSRDGGELWFNWIVRAAPGGHPVGAMQATVAADGVSADLAWEVGVPWQGRGFAAEAAAGAVGWLVDAGVVTLCALIHPAHEASARVAASLGLEPSAEIVDGEVVWRRSAR
jgi:RimJ/RimL family protein N-acetyltransferase